MLSRSLDFMKNIVGNLKPDDIVFHKPGNHYYISLLREDKVESCHHLVHPDLPKLTLMSRMSHSYCIHQLLEKWHSDIATIGLTTDKEKANVYALYSDIGQSISGQFNLDYSIRFLGSFFHNHISHRIHLVALILIAMKNIHHQEMASNLNTKSVTSRGTIGSAEASFKKKLSVSIRETTYWFIPDKTFNSISRNDKIVQKGLLKLDTNNESQVLETILKRCSHRTEQYKHYKQSNEDIVFRYSFINTYPQFEWHSSTRLYQQIRAQRCEKNDVPYFVPNFIAGKT
ncbi:hypothetical protein C9374_007036 [Naegleria lovaniensis]|uniref:Uncharacterized protein n=1 Tax=Naegleria lovaniensis TaxID=51637 RepID=A0AA88KXW9_NAELO|nr:uncharacterized protein C9374_007036 [Naegleria lovaniensis]KAG2393505.1 hypothetical protein C9374_007036 [Naegleria lovaniensis]